MLKIILTMLLAVSGLFAQYGNSFIVNGDMEINGTWAATGTPVVFRGQSSEQAHDGIYSWKLETAAAYVGIYNGSYATITNNDYRVRAWIYVINSPKFTLLIRNGANTGWAYSVTYSGLVADNWNYYVVNYTESSGGAYARIQLESGTATASTRYFDSVTWQQKLDTLYIDCEMADDTDNDTTKTLTEAFEIRGAHLGGYFDIIGDHTAEEKATIDSSGALIYSSQSGSVDTLDFNNTAWTVDLENLTITTATNDGNVTYINRPLALKQYLEYPVWSGEWLGW